VDLISRCDVDWSALFEQCCLQLLGIVGATYRVSQGMGTQGITPFGVQRGSYFHCNHALRRIKKDLPVVTIEIQIYMGRYFAGKPFLSAC